jgi:hypothetical protein
MRFLFSVFFFTGFLGFHSISFSQDIDLGYGLLSKQDEAIKGIRKLIGNRELMAF